MFRSLTISLGAHMMLVIALVVLSYVSPPTPHVVPVMNVRILKPMTAPLLGEPSRSAPSAPAPAPPAAPPKVQAEPSPAPPPPPEPAKPTPAATPAPPPPKKSDNKNRKEIVEDVKKKDIVELTPTPAPTPETTPSAELTPKPEATPASTAKPGPAPARTPQPAKSPGPAPSGTPPPVPSTVMPAGTDKTQPGSKPGPAPAVPAGVVGTGPARGLAVGPVSTDGALMEQGEAYNSRVLFAIQTNFKPPYEQPGATCSIQFRIMKDGEIKDAKVARSSGRSDLDQAAMRALVETARVPSLYDDFPKEFIEVQVTFDFQKRS